MKKILFFIENNWSFGRIHNDLIKVLYPDVYCDIIDWRISYTLQDMSNFLRIYDYIITTPHGAMTLNSSYKVPLNRIGAIAHSNSDIQHILYTHNLGKQYFDEFKSYGVISPIIRTMSITHGIYRIPHVLQIGCFNDLHEKNTSTQLSRIGYVGKINRAFQEEVKDIKRGNLIIEISEKTNTPLIHHENLHFLCSRRMYCDFDLMMFSSLTEGLPTVAIESFCSGVPILGTHTGIFPDMCNSGGGIILPFEEKQYIEMGIEIINDLKKNPDKYQHMVNCALKESQKYDWSNNKHSWIKFIDSLYT
jgi:glycosyltransferase involved in cell wall biosynthesis